MWSGNEKAAEETKKVLAKKGDQSLALLELSSSHVEWLGEKKADAGFNKVLFSALVKLVISSKTKTESFHLKVSLAKIKTRTVIVRTMLMPYFTGLDSSPTTGGSCLFQRGSSSGNAKGSSQESGNYHGVLWKYPGWT